MIGNYCNSSVGHDLCAWELLKNAYREGELSLIVEQLVEWVFKILDAFIDRNSVECT